MPKLFKDNASGMHVHQSIWKGKTNLFHRTQYAELSEAWQVLSADCSGMPGRFAGSTLQQRTLRQVPGYGPPINLVYSQRKCSACLPAAARDSLPGVASTAPRRHPQSPPEALSLPNPVLTADTISK